MADEERRKIRKAVRLPLEKGGHVFKPGDERKLAEADLPPESLRKLQERGAVSGFVADDDEDAPDLPPVRELSDVLAGMPRDAVEDAASRDRRKSARPYYEARLRELDKEEKKGEKTE